MHEPYVPGDVITMVCGHERTITFNDPMDPSALYWCGAAECDGVRAVETSVPVYRFLTEQITNRMSIPEIVNALVRVLTDDDDLLKVANRIISRHRRLML